MGVRPSDLFRHLAILGLAALVGRGDAAWQYLPVGVARAETVAADSSGQRLLLGTLRAGLWLSTDAGIVWDPINNRIIPVGSDVTGLSVDVLDPSADTMIVRIWCSELTTGLIRTFDGGTTWQPVSLPCTGGIGQFATVWRRSHSMWFQIVGTCFARSLDFGQTWAWWQMDSTTGYKTGLYQDPLRDSILYCTGDYSLAGSDGWAGGVNRSLDLGGTWSVLLDLHGLFGVDVALVTGMAVLSNGDLLALVFAIEPYMWENENIVISTDDGASWARFGEGLPDRFRPAQLIEDPLAAGTVFVIGMQKYGLYRSRDWGRTWERCLNGLPENVSQCGGLYANPFSGAVYVAVEGVGAFETRDHGESWQTLPMPPIGLTGLLSLFDGSLFFRDDGFRLWRRDEGPGQWVELQVPLAEDTLVMIRPICYHNGDTLVSGLWKRNIIGPVTDHFQMTYSYDDGAHWTVEPFLPFLPDHYFDVLCAPSLVRFLSYNPSLDTVLISEDLGRTWFARDLPGAFQILALAQNDSAIYAVGREPTGPSQVLRSTDRGQSWHDLRYEGPTLYSDSSPFLIADDLYLRAGDRCVRWANGSWETRGTIAVPEWESFWWMIPVLRADTVLFGAAFLENHVWLSQDLGWTWSEPEYELPYPSQNLGFDHMLYDPAQDRIWASAGVGVCYLDGADISADGPLHFKPADYTLLSVYPNPFNSEARIRFDLDRAARVSLRVYDLTGRLVRTVVDDVENAGRHELTFNGSDLASGTYFVHLRTDKGARTQKILLLK